jgi:hypothetical protein
VEAIVFCGIQGSGKTSFYRERFLETHVRISLDMLRTRRREAILVRACLEAQQRFVIDNTNPTVEERRRYVGPARGARFRVVGYLFEATPRQAIARNAERQGRARIPVSGLLGTYKRLQPPTLTEGFSALYRVRIDAEHGGAGAGAQAHGGPPAQSPRRRPNATTDAGRRVRLAENGRADV